MKVSIDGNSSSRLHFFVRNNYFLFFLLFHFQHLLTFLLLRRHFLSFGATSIVYVIVFCEANLIQLHYIRCDIQRLHIFICLFPSLCHSHWDHCYRKFKKEKRSASTWMIAVIAAQYEYPTAKKLKRQARNLRQKLNKKSASTTIWTQWKTDPYSVDRLPLTVCKKRAPLVSWSIDLQRANFFKCDEQFFRRS